MQSPERAEAAPATRKERTTAGPAVFLATPPARTYTPTPRVEPIPRRVRSVVLRHLLSPPWPSPPAVASSLFLRVNRDFNPSNIFASVVVWQELRSFLEEELGLMSALFEVWH